MINKLSSYLSLSILSLSVWSMSPFIISMSAFSSCHFLEIILVT